MHDKENFVKEKFIGYCSRFVNGQGWTTEIPVKAINAKGYYKVDTDETKQKIAQTFAMAEYVDGEAGLLVAVKTFIKENLKPH